jgi:hypothetical protein
VCSRRSAACAVKETASRSMPAQSILFFITTPSLVDAGTPRRASDHHAAATAGEPARRRYGIMA